MASPAPTNLGRRLRIAAAGAAVVTALTVATASASPPTPMGDAAPMGAQAPAMSRPGASPSQDSSARSPAPGFLLDRGRYTPVAIPPRLAATAPQGIVPVGINERGQVVGFSGNDPTGTAVSGFLLERGRFTPITRPGAAVTVLFGINNRGQVVGAAGNPGDQASTEPTDPRPMARMA
jgi:hypothetical protein